MGDTIAQDKPTCPHCGHTERDAWEIDFGPGGDGDTVITCGQCDEEYMCYRHVTLHYNNYKIDGTG